MNEPNIKRYKLVTHKWPDEIAAQRNKRNRQIISLLIIVAVAIAAFLGGTLYSPANKINSGSNAKFNKAFEIMKDEFYYGKGNSAYKQKLMDEAIKGMLNGGGDIHTSYMDAKSASSFQDKMEGHFVGIGIQFYELEIGQFIISDVLRDTPAEEGGLLAGDQIISVNGKSIEKDDSTSISKKIKGEPESTVKIGVMRDNEKHEIAIVRRDVSSSVFSEQDGEIGILEITNFTSSSGDETKKQLESLKKSGCNKLIIDLRDNTGGYLDAVQQIASYLLPSGSTILKQKDKNGNYSDYVAKNSKQIKFDNIVLLVNESSASASEVLTAAMRDNTGTKVVGVKTYGKGTVQVPYDFDDGSMIKYTIAEWLSPKGVAFHGVGIEPDYRVELDPVVSMALPELEKDEVIKPDTVHIGARYVQNALQFLGYDADRRDFYFSPKSSAALKSFQGSAHLAESGEVDDETLKSLVSSCAKKWRNEKVTLDLQMKKAKVIVNER